MSSPQSAQGSPRTLACPNCGGLIEVRAAGSSVNLGCQHCGAILDVARPEAELISRYTRYKRRFALKLGARGQLFGQEWAVIGAMTRRDSGGSWSEYLLYNPYVGYRWLVEFQGKWQFGTTLLELPEGDDRAVVWQDESYRAQWEDEEEAVTGAVLGEFYWRIANGDRARCLSFQRGDVVLSRETGENEVTWTQLVPVAADEIAAAFGVDPRRMPRTRQPASRSLPLRTEAGGLDILPAMLLLASATAILTLLAMVFIAGPVDRISTMVGAPFGATNEGSAVGTLEIRRPWQFVRIKARAENFDNDWVDLDYTLVNRATGQAMTGYGLVERYSGRDSDGPWTEGDGQSNILLGTVQRGVYDLYVDAASHSWPRDVTPAERDAWSVSQIPVTITAETGGLPWSNWVILCILLLIPPGFVLWHRFRNL